MNLIVQTLADGLVLGGIYALAAVGFSLIFGVLHVINLSHGILVLLGAYLALILSQALGIDPLLTLPVVMAVLFGVGYCYQRFLIQHAVDRSQLGSMLLTFGVALMLQNVMIWVFSPDMQQHHAELCLHFVPARARSPSTPCASAPCWQASFCSAASPLLPEILAARPRHSRHRAADPGGAAVRRQRAACLCAHLRRFRGVRRSGRDRDRHHPAVLARRRGDLDPERLRRRGAGRRRQPGRRADRRPAARHRRARSPPSISGRPFPT